MTWFTGILAAITAVSDAVKVLVGMKTSAEVKAEKERKQIEDAAKDNELPPPPRGI